MRVLRGVSELTTPGGFPPPEFHLAEGSPLWAWSSVSYWLAQNDMIRPEEGWNAEVVAAINNWLEIERGRERHPELIAQISKDLAKT